MLNKNYAKRHILNVLLFVLLIFLPIINMILHIFPDFESTDYRKLTEFPKSITSLRDLPSQFQAYFDDNFSFRNAFIRINGSLHYYLLNTPVSDDVIIGKDNFMFLKYDRIMMDYHGEVIVKEAELEKSLYFFKQLKKYVESNGAKFILAVSPEAHTIYGNEYLPAYENYNRGNPRRLDQYIKYFNNQGIEICDYRQELLIAKTESEDLLYYKTDNHWNQLGAQYGFKKIIESINKQGIDISIPEYKMYQNGYHTDGDISRLIATLRTSKYIPSWNYDFGPDITFEVTNNDFPHYDMKSNINNDLCAIMFNDSYGGAFYNIYGVTFSESHVTNLNYLLETLPWQIETYHPDVVIFECVERNLTLWPSYVFPEELIIDN